jgi:hypothetical protein
MNKRGCGWRRKGKSKGKKAHDGTKEDGLCFAWALCEVSWKETAEAFIDPRHNHRPSAWLSHCPS